MIRPRLRAQSIAATVILCAAGAAAPAVAADFYAGKTIEILVGSAAGGSFHTGGMLKSR